MIGDSVRVLSSLNLKVDLLYLDSFDLELNNPHPSQLHHLKELTSSIQLLKPGTLIAVDDHRLPEGIIGKGKYVDEYLSQIGCRKIHDGYQLIYLW
jgi:hypothetical protein